MMKKRILPCAVAVCLMVGLMAACGTDAASTTSASGEVSVAEVTKAPETPTPTQTPEPQVESAVESKVEPGSAEEVSEPEKKTCTVTFSDGQTFEATVGEDFVFFFQCDAPGDMGEPNPGEEGAGITTSDGTVTYSNVGLGGPFRYPTSEKVTISGFQGDFEVTITEAATNMGATYTIYTEEQDIADAIAFAEEMAKQQAENPMPAPEG